MRVSRSPVKVHGARRYHSSNGLASDVPLPLKGCSLEMHLALRKYQEIVKRVPDIELSKAPRLRLNCRTHFRRAFPPTPIVDFLNSFYSHPPEVMAWGRIRVVTHVQVKAIGFWYCQSSIVVLHLKA